MEQGQERTHSDVVAAVAAWVMLSGLLLLLTFAFCLRVAEEELWDEGHRCDDETNDHF